MYLCCVLLGSPVSRWASVAFGAGLGIGSAYTECSRLFEGSPAKSAAPKMVENPAPKIVENPAPQVDLISSDVDLFHSVPPQH
ncbi:hypothetical protein ACFX13_045097 [Malus domestica]